MILCPASNDDVKNFVNSHRQRLRQCIVKSFSHLIWFYSIGSAQKQIPSQCDQDIKPHSLLYNTCVIGSQVGTTNYNYISMVRSCFTNMLPQMLTMTYVQFFNITAAIRESRHILKLFITFLWTWLFISIAVAAADVVTKFKVHLVELSSARQTTHESMVLTLKASSLSDDV